MTKATVSIVMELDFDHVVGDERQLIKATTWRWAKALVWLIVVAAVVNATLHLGS